MRKLLLGFMLAALTGITADAQSYPTRSISVTVPASAGGPTDTIARIVTARMQQALGQSIIIENVGGASGTIATGKVTRADPDGYTLIIGGVNHFVVNGAVYPLAYNLVNDFEPISMLSTGPMLIMSRNSLPANNLAELIAWLKANPDKATEGTGGSGSGQHIGGVYFQKVTGTSFVFVPYKAGSADVMRDVVAGHIDLSIDQAISALPYIRQGQLRAFAVADSKRLASAPDIPTVDEAGAPGVYISVWYGLWVPKGTPHDVIAKLNAAAVEALADPAVRKQLENLGLTIPPLDQQSPEALGAWQKAEIAKWWPMIKTANVKVE